MRAVLEPKNSALETESLKNPYLHFSEPNRVGFAVVGLSAACAADILPAFEWCENARLSAIVSSDQAKATDIARAYDVPQRSVYTFHDFDRIKNDRDVQAVFISLHGPLRDDMILRAARAGKHIICEGRISSDTWIDREIARVCDEAGVKLMIVYRKATRLDLDHMANCVLRLRAPMRLSDVLRGTESIRVDVSRWAN